jgi:hypothetical protein
MDLVSRYRTHWYSFRIRNFPSYSW